MADFTDYLGLRSPTEGVDYMRASLDLKLAYDLIDVFASKVGDPFRGAMYRGSDGTLRVAGSFFTVDWDQLEYNVGNICNLAGDKFVAPTLDDYLYIFQCRWGNGNSGSPTARQIAITRNGVQVASSYTVDSPTNRGPAQQCAWMGRCQQGDEFQAVYRHDDTGTVNFVTDLQGGTWFRAVRQSFNND